MRNQKKTLILRVVFGTLLVCVLIGCIVWNNTKPQEAAKLQQNLAEQEDTEQTETITEAETKEEWVSRLHSVPYFRDDTGQLVQVWDGYVYGYWNGRLCQYDEETMEKTVLYEAAERQSGYFKVYDGYIYFLDVPKTDSLTGADTVLYRVKCDGSELAALAKNLPNRDIHSYERPYKVDIYDNVLYLVNGEENLYFRLNEDGSVTEVTERETLYGKISEEWRPLNSSEVTLPYYMNNYGYLLLENGSENILQLDIENGEKKYISLEDRCDWGSLTLTNQGLAYITHDGESYYCDLDTGYSEPWGNMEQADIGYDETGIYFVDWDNWEEPVKFFIRKVDWQGNESQIPFDNAEKEVSFYHRAIDDGYRGSSFYVTGKYLYYCAETEDGSYMKRLALDGTKDAEIVDVFWEKGDLGDYEVVEETETVIGGFFSVDTTFKKVFLEEDSDADIKINKFLKDVYKQHEKENEDMLQSMNEEYEGEPDNYPYGGDVDENGINRDDYMLICAWVEHYDNNYISVIVTYEDYWFPGNHGYYYADYYVFDRTTGERVQITDVINNTEEEIVEIISTYAEAATGAQLKAENILEPDRFHLTREGIGIHYDVYEIGGWADGGRDFVIPYKAFSMKKE